MIKTLRILMIAFCIICLLPTFLLQSISPLLNYVVKDAQVRIDSVSLNPMRGSLNIEGAHLTPSIDQENNKDSHQTNQGHTSLDRLYIDIALLKLIDKKLLIESLILEGMDNKTTLTPNQVSFGIDIPLGQKPPEQEPTPSQPTEWQIGLVEAQLRDIHLSMVQNEVTNTLALEQLQLCNIAQWVMHTPSCVPSMQGHVNGHTLEQSVALNNLSQNPNTPHLHLTIAQLPIHLNNPLPHLPKANITSTLSMDTSLQTHLTEGHFNLTSHIELADTQATWDNNRLNTHLIFTASATGNVKEGHYDLNAKTLLSNTELQLKNDAARMDLILDTKAQGNFKDTAQPQRITSTLTVNNLHANAPSVPIITTVQSLSLDADVSLTASPSFSIQSHKPLELTSTHLNVQFSPYFAKLDALALDTNVDFSSEHIRLDALKWQHKGLHVKSQGQNVVSLKQSFAHFPEISVTPSSKHTSLTMERLELDQLQILNQESPLLALQTAHIENLDITLKPNKTSVYAQSLTLEDGRSVLDLKKGSISQVASIIALTTTDNAPTTLEEPKKETTKLKQATTKSKQETTETAQVAQKDPTDKDSKTTLELKVDRISAHNYTVHFTDHDTTPDNPIPMTWQLQQLNLQDINNQQPNQPMRIDATLVDQTYATIQSKGTVYPFASPIALDINNSIASLELLNYSPYVRMATAYNVKSGVLNASNTTHLKNNIIEAKTTLRFNKLSLEKTDQPSPYDKELPVPLNTALYTIKDSEGNIKLKVPIKGDLNDPKVGINSLFRIAFNKALTVASIKYLRQLLQPYALLFDVYAGTKALKQQIPLFDIEHTSMTTTLTKQGQKQAEKLGKTLRKKEEMHVRLCSHTSEQETQQLVDQAQTLRKERSASLKAWLIAKYNIKPERLQLCTKEKNSETPSTVIYL